MSISNFTGYILAGGKSSRMGRDKAFLEIGGKTFIENASDALKRNCIEIKVVLNSNQKHFIEKLPREISYIFDVHENRGALGGIYAALKDCETDFAIILACDMPFVISKTIENLTKIALSENFAAIVPRQTDGRLQPLCAVYRVKDCLFNAEKLLSKDISVSMRDFLEIIESKIIEAGDLSGNKNLFVNVNSQADFEKTLLHKYKT